VNNMDELQEKVTEILSDEDAIYYAHFMRKNGSIIMENGLLVANPNWYESFYRLTSEEINNIDEFIDDKITKYTDYQTVIIAVSYPDEITKDNDPLIRKLEDFEEILKYNSNFEGVGAPDYIVDSYKMVGYIDILNREFITREESIDRGL